jgi:hypothetical protein
MPHVSTSLRPTASGVLTPLVLVLFVAVGLGAAPQEPTDPPVISLERIREGLERPPALRLDVQPQPHVAVFRMSVEQRVFVLTFEEQLHKDFDLTPMQRQSANWASACCGLDVGQLVKGIERARQRLQERRAHEQVARELAEVEAAWKKPE